MKKALLPVLVCFIVGCPTVVVPPDDPCDSCTDTETCVEGVCVENEVVGDAGFGEAFYMANGCMSCHGEDGSGPPSLINEEAGEIFDKLSGAVSHVGGTFDATEQGAADLAAWLEG